MAALVWWIAKVHLSLFWSQALRRDDLGEENLGQSCGRDRAGRVSNRQMCQHGNISGANVTTTGKILNPAEFREVGDAERDVKIKGQICNYQNIPGWGKGVTFVEKSLKHSWFADPSSPSTKGEYVRALVVPTPHRCKNISSTDCITDSMIMPDFEFGGLTEFISKHQTIDGLDENKLYAVATFKEGEGVYKFANHLEIKRALCLFFHWNTALDASGEKIPAYDVWAAKEWPSEVNTNEFNRRSMFAKGPEAWWSKSGHSGYWDFGAIYHETGHALWHALVDERSMEGLNRLDLALQEGFCDAFSCHVQMKTKQIKVATTTRKEDCEIGAYFDKSSGGVRSRPYKAQGDIDDDHKFNYIVKHKCNTKVDDLDTCEKHRVGEIFASALYRVMASGVDWRHVLDGIKELLDIVSVPTERVGGSYAVHASQFTLVQTMRDCIMKQITDANMYATASLAFADSGMGVEMDQTESEGIGKAGTSAVSIGAGAKYYNTCRVRFVKPLQ